MSLAYSGFTYFHLPLHHGVENVAIFIVIGCPLPSIPKVKPKSNPCSASSHHLNISGHIQEKSGSVCMRSVISQRVTAEYIPPSFRTRKLIYATDLNLVSQFKAPAGETDILLSSPNPALLCQLIIKLEWKEETCLIVTISPPQPQELCSIIFVEKLNPERLSNIQKSSVSRRQS